jgi:DNA adenine methylase
MPFLGEAIRANKLSNGTFVEPFAGSSAAAIHLLLGEFVERIVINDFDYNIYCLWWSILNEPNALIDLVESTKVTVRNWKAQRAVYRSPRRVGKLRVGFSTLFLNRCNRSGILVSAGPIGGIKQTGRWKIDARFNRKTLADQIRRISEFRNRIDLHNRDGLVFLRQVIGRRASVKNTLVFLDPPYFDKADRLYRSDFDFKKHKRLRNHLLSASGYKWVLTYDQHKDAEDLYKSRRPAVYHLPYAAHSSRRGAEILVRSPHLRVDFDLLPGAECHQ